MAPKKRKADGPGHSRKTQKKEGEQTDEAGEAVKVNNSTLLQWLLSDDALSLAYPSIEPGKGEVDWSEEDVAKGGNKAPPPPVRREDKSDDGDEVRQTPLLYPAPYPTFSPFLTLLSSYFLSKPISHKLGLRTISTALNTPFDLRTRTSWERIGYEGRRRVMWEAKTQHKEKSAEQLGYLLTGLRELEADEEGDEEEDQLKTLKSYVDKAAKDIQGAESRTGAKEAIREHLTKIKGIGPGACEIFMRRIQHPWASLYPYADSRSLEYAHEIGLLPKPLPGTEYTAPEDMDTLLLKRTNDLLQLCREAGLGVEGEGDDEEREKFVRVLDVLVGLGLQKQLQAGKKRAAASAVEEDDGDVKGER